jgi:hypothetical protein
LAAPEEAEEQEAEEQEAEEQEAAWGGSPGCLEGPEVERLRVTVVRALVSAAQRRPARAVGERLGKRAAPGERQGAAARARLREQAVARRTVELD